MFHQVDLVVQPAAVRGSYDEYVDLAFPGKEVDVPWPLQFEFRYISGKNKVGACCSPDFRPIDFIRLAIAEFFSHLFAESAQVDDFISTFFGILADKPGYARRDFTADGAFEMVEAVDLVSEGDDNHLAALFIRYRRLERGT